MGKITYPTPRLERIYLIQKKLIRILTLSLHFELTQGPYVLQTKPRMFVISIIIIGTFKYECLYGNIPEIFRNYFQSNADVYDHNNGGEP